MYEPPIRVTLTVRRDGNSQDQDPAIILPENRAEWRFQLSLEPSAEAGSVLRDAPHLWGKIRRGMLIPQGVDAVALFSASADDEGKIDGDMGMTIIPNVAITERAERNVSYTTYVSQLRRILVQEALPAFTEALAKTL